jgi:transglutaminase-like putative cysteine protease
MGTRATLAAMAQLANEAVSDPSFRMWVYANVPSTLDGMEAWIRARFRYRPEQEEVVRTIPFQLDHLAEHGYIEGDCDDVSTFLAAIAKAFGYRVRLVAIRSDSVEFQHVFVEMQPVGAVLPGAWVRSDPTVVPNTIHKELERMVVYV